LDYSELMMVGEF